MNKFSTLILIFCSLFLCSINAIASSNNSEKVYSYNYSLENNCSDIDDPFERVNRKIFIFNSVLDHFLLRPVAKGYKYVLNDYTRDKIGNLVDNLYVPLTTVNNVLQADPDNVLISFWQFVINSTFGIGGLFDITSSFGIKKTKHQTFGSTLARYGVSSGPYVVLPFYGSTNLRDIFDFLVFNNNLNPLTQSLHKDFALGMAGITLVQRRAEILDFTDYVARTSSDPYVTIRSTYHQNREQNLRYPSTYRCSRIYNK